MNARYRFLLLIQLVFLLAWLTPASAQESPAPVIVLTFEGPLTPAMQQYLARGIQTAGRQGAQAVIIQLDTPGGSVDLMNQLVQVMRASPVPVVVFIAPPGAIAGSAGTILTLAGHAAAMAPETAIGAASPVGPQGEDLGETMQAKEKNILKATARSLAERRGPQAVQIAEQTIESAQAVSASEALQAGLVDFIARDIGDLLEQLDGFTVTTPRGEVTLQTSGAIAEPLIPSWIEQLLGILTNPNLVFLLLTIGVQAIIIELSSPGGWVSGFIGVVCLGLAAYGLGVLPVNWFGLLFLGTAFVLFILDIKAPTHGALTLAGVGSLVVGALVLFNSPGTPTFQRVSVPLVIIVSLITAGVFFGILTFALRARKLPVRMGQESLIGRTGVVRAELSPVGTVQLGGELWTAELAVRETGPIAAGTRVQVVSAKGVRLFVRRADGSADSSLRSE
ncbi:MAG TPA: nodulation protein NfeD [Anaerolineales bacterium]|nr:nodulation protein NfeD [Anaerolineales bacterium]